MVLGFYLNGLFKYHKKALIVRFFFHLFIFLVIKEKKSLSDITNCVVQITDIDNKNINYMEEKELQSQVGCHVS